MPRPRSSGQSQTPPAPSPENRSLQQIVSSNDHNWNSKPTNHSNSKAPIRITHPDKILDPASHLTKQQLANYYQAIAPYLFPHIANRPLSLVRCPDGTQQPCFFQRHATGTLPPGVKSIPIADKTSTKPEPYLTLSTPEALVSLAQIGVLELHPWGSCIDDLEHPDRIIFDLDPDPALPWPSLAAAAAEIRQRLKKIGLASFLKLTGGKGLHVVVPIQPHHDWATVKEFAHTFALQLEHSNHTLYLTKMTKSARTGKIFLDYLRNERSATAVAPYSPRARPGAPVSLPLHWAELKLPERPVFPVADFPTWKPRLRRDPWKQLPLIHQSLPLKPSKSPRTTRDCHPARGRRTRHPPATSP